MTRHGTVLPIPDDPRVGVLIDEWPALAQAYGGLYPRSYWLGLMESVLREDLPGHSSRDYNVTARSLAPFPLAEPTRYIG